jgi:S1-C subfamily serine protease
MRYSPARRTERTVDIHWPRNDDELMLRALVVAMLWSVVPGAAAAQAPGNLHIKVVLLDAARRPTPVPRHALLISDNPPTAAPRRIVTALDGTADLRLRPGNYTVESDRPLAFEGKAYIWTQMVDIAAGRDAFLELTSDNAEVDAVTAATATAGAASEPDPSSILTQWQDSVVALWTPTTHASAFVIDANGLIATNQRGIGTATAVEVQLTPGVKVAAAVLAVDALRDVAILWIDPKAAASVRPVPLGCAQGPKPLLSEGQEIVTIGVPLRQPKGTASGIVSRVAAETVVADLILATGSAGGPVFTAGGVVVGITSVVDGNDEIRRGDSRIVGIDRVCDVVAAAEKKMKDTAPPNGAHLPVEPVRPFPVAALKDAAGRRAGSLSPYQLTSSDFDIAFITPVLTYGAQYQAEQASRRGRRPEAGAPDAEQGWLRPLVDFGNWSDYVADFPPVLLVRVTPKLVEGFWTRVARGAAQTQGISLPPIKRFTSGFSRLRALCGDAEVPPIHPFKLERRLSENDAIYEGLYVFDPGALGPQCASVTLVLYSEKEPGKADTRVIDPKVVQQIWDDFAPYRAIR